MLEGLYETVLHNKIDDGPQVPLEASLRQLQGCWVGPFGVLGGLWAFRGLGQMICILGSGTFSTSVWEFPSTVGKLVLDTLQPHPVSKT